MRVLNYMQCHVESKQTVLIWSGQKKNRNVSEIVFTMLQKVVLFGNLILEWFYHELYLFLDYCSTS